MSEYAALKSGEKFCTALYFRDLFLRNETVYSFFICPFCGVKLSPVLIYKDADEKLGKRPHFRLKHNDEKHKKGCDGNSPDRKLKLTIGKTKNSVEKQIFLLPVEFAKHKEYSSIFRTQKVNIDSDTEDNIENNINSNVDYRYKARYRVTVIQSLVEAYRSVIYNAYIQQKLLKWTDEQRKEHLKLILQAPLNLRGLSTTYNTAFHNLAIPIPAYPRIFYGANAKVIKTSECYEIIPERKNWIANKPFEQLSILIRLNNIILENLKGAKKNNMKNLIIAGNEQKTVIWYAYGLAEKIAGSKFQLCFDEDNLSDLYTKL
jgi:hypothetical protein